MTLTLIFITAFAVLLIISLMIPLKLKNILYINAGDLGRCLQRDRTSNTKHRRNLKKNPYIF